MIPTWSSNSITRRSLALAFVPILTFSGLAVAADVDKAIEYRQSAFKLMGWHFSPMGQMMRGKIDYDPEEFARRAEAINSLAEIPWEGFVANSYRGDGHGVDTDSKASIAANQDDFDARIEAFIEEAASLEAIAAEGDFNASRGAFAQVMDTCKGCHDNYRAK